MKDSSRSSPSGCNICLTIMRHYAAAILLGAALIWGSPAHTSPSRSSEGTLSLHEVLERCASLGTEIVSCTGRFRVDAEDQRRGDRHLMPQTVAGSWAVSGNRFREESVVTFPALGESEQADLAAQMERARSTKEAWQVRPHGSQRQFVVFDGSTGSVREYEADGNLMLNQPLVGKDAVQQATAACRFTAWLGIPALGQFRLLVSPIPTKHDAPEIAGRELVLGTDCIKLIGRNPRWHWWYTWWIAPRYGYLVLREDMISYPPRASADADKIVLRRTRVKKVQSFEQGIHLPVAVERVTAKVNQDGSIARVYRREHFTATEITVNEPLPEELFKLPPGSSSP